MPKECLAWLARSVRGDTPEERNRRWDRYALIGGCCLDICCELLLARRARKLALRLLFGTAPMVFVAVWKKILRSYANPLQPIVLPEQ